MVVRGLVPAQQIADGLSRDLRHVDCGHSERLSSWRVLAQKSDWADDYGSKILKPDRRVLAQKSDWADD